MSFELFLSVSFFFFFFGGGWIDEGEIGIIRNNAEGDETLVVQ